MNTTIPGAQEPSCPLYETKGDEQKSISDPRPEKRKCPKRAGAVSPEGQELERKGAQIWARLWLSFVQAVGRGVGLRGGTPERIDTPRGDKTKTAITPQPYIRIQSAVYQMKGLDVRNVSTS